MIPLDVEGLVRDWLLTRTTVTDQVSTRIWFGVPVDVVEGEYPLVTVARVGGGQPSGGGPPLDVALLQLDVWGPLRRKDLAWQAAAAVVTALDEELEARTVLASGAVAFGAETNSVLWSPDPSDGRPRYVLTTQVTVGAG